MANALLVFSLLLFGTLCYCIYFVISSHVDYVSEYRILVCYLKYTEKLEFTENFAGKT